MKLFDENMQTGRAPGNFGFSGVRPEKLGAAEYTLVTYVGDKTGSLSGFEQALLTAEKTVVGACQKSPRAEFLLLRKTAFNSSVDEVHGFTELSNIDPTKYVAPHCSGTTALYDATFSAIAATNEYAKTLSDAEFSVNGIIFVVTDGGESGKSVQTVKSIKAELSRGVQNEWLESLMVILIGVNAGQASRELQAFEADAGLTKYIDIGDITDANLARMADFISRSVSSQSQANGTGGPSQALNF